MVETEATKNELEKKVAKLIPPNPFHPLAKFSTLQAGGIKFIPPFNISVLFLSEPLIIQSTGYIMRSPNRHTNKW